MTCCYLGLGSNLNTPPRQLRIALAFLRQCPRSTITHASTLFKSRPLGLRSQPRYYNMVVALQTSLSPSLLFMHCQRIEQNMQRCKKQHWGARVIDIDILLYGEQTIRQSNLIIPHPEMLKRDFVLYPLLEISPDACLPTGERIISYAENCETYLLSSKNLG